MKNYYFDYVLQTFDRLYGRPEDLSIGYASSDDIQLEQHSDAFFHSKNVRPAQLCWKTWKESNIPILFTGDDSKPVFSIKGDRVQIHYDIIGSAFYFLSGWQEFHSEVRDDLGRYPYKESLQYLHGFTSLPVVNYYFDILKTAIEKITGSELKRKLWPEVPIAVFLSHDVDKINSGWKEEAFASLKKGQLMNMLIYAGSKLFGKDPWDNIPEILQLERELGVSSTWFFIPEQGNGNADYEQRQLQTCEQKVIRKGGETALHGSLYSGGSSEKMLQEKEMLSDLVSGNRFHFLKFEPRTIAEILEISQFTYDSSMGFAEHVGFRNGFCFPFQPYHIPRKKPMEFFEFPLMVMDATLYQDQYMGNHPHKMDLMKKVIDEVKKFNGMLSLLWHNNYFSDCKYKGWGERYVALIKELQQDGALFLTGHQLRERMDEG